MHHPHFLLSAAARTLSMREVFAMSDDQAFEAFREVRWGRDGEPVCPACGVVERHWFLSSRRQWRCQDCGHTFSVTSGTIFAHHKLPLQIYLGAIALYSHAVKGLSALQLSRDLDVQYKTAFVLMHKLRQSLMDQRDETPLAGEVQAGLRGLVLPFAWSCLLPLRSNGSGRDVCRPHSSGQSFVHRGTGRSTVRTHRPTHTLPSHQRDWIRSTPLHPLPSTATGASNPPVAVPRTDRNGGHCPSQKLLLGQDNRRDRQVGIHDPQSPNSRPWVRDWQIMVAVGWQVQPAPRANLCCVAVKTVAPQLQPTQHQAACQESERAEHLEALA